MSKYVKRNLFRNSIPEFTCWLNFRPKYSFWMIFDKKRQTLKSVLKLQGFTPDLRNFHTLLTKFGYRLCMSEIGDKFMKSGTRSKTEEVGKTSFQNFGKMRLKLCRVPCMNEM